MEKYDGEKDCWDIVDSLFRESSNLVKHHVHSFDYFVSNQIEQILREYNDNIKSVITSDWNKERSIFRYEYHIKFGKISISRPSIREVNGSFKPLLPNEARLRDLSYAATIKVDIYHYLVENLPDGTHTRQDFLPSLNYELTKLPMLIQSRFCNLVNLTPQIRHELGECLYDYGGYFVEKGVERVLIMQERKAENMVLVFKIGKNNSMYSHKAEIRSISEERPFVESGCEVKFTSRDTSSGRLIYVKIQEIRQDLPLGIVFRALGFISDREIAEAIIYDMDSANADAYLEYLKPSLEESSPYFTAQMAYEYLVKYIPSTARAGSDNELKWSMIQDILRNDFLPHIEKNLRSKGIFLGYMTRRLLDAVLTEQYDDRDSFINKRVATTGKLIASLFRGNFRKMMRDVESSIRSDLQKHKFEDLGSATSLAKRFKITTIFSGIRTALKTGNWNVKNTGTSTASGPTGISQILSRLSYAGTISHLRRLQTPIDRNMKSVPPRLLNGTQWGIICAAETPEGSSAGIVKHLALLSTVTLFSKTDIVTVHFTGLGVINIDDVTSRELGLFTKVFINGAWVGVHAIPHIFVKQLRDMRRKGVLHPYTSIHLDFERRSIFIFTDAGRITRPLLIVENNEPLITKEVIMKLRHGTLRWEDMFNANNPLQTAVLEYVDTMESDGIMIAMTESSLHENRRENPTFVKYTHMEIHPSFIFGSVACSIPFTESNQGPRLHYSAAQQKQALGIFASNFQRRLDTISMVIYHPQRPLVQTRNSRYVNYNELPPGMNAVVAYCSYGGFNQDDAIIMNSGSIDRGLYTTSFYRTYVAKEQRNQQALEEEKFCKPDRLHLNGALKTQNMNGHSYDKLQDDGFVKTGTFVTEGDAIIGKVIPLKTCSDDDVKFRDASMFIRPYENGTVDWVFVSYNDEGGHKFGKVRVRSERFPEIGDKFTSRYAQKGTVGMVYSQEDMPYNHDGISPDLIVNPHAYPSRMTIGQLIETLVGKAGACIGSLMDSTPFQNYSVEEIGRILQQYCGWEHQGNEVLYHGRTGKQIECAIFMGPTYYLRLRHMVSDKIHARAEGPRVLLTRQPTEGRSREGGLRIGEMERDVIISHGTAQFLKERMYDSSDKYYVYICKQSGLIAAVNSDEGTYKSLYSDNTVDFVKVQIPYASKLFIQELMSMGIAPRLIT